MKSILVFLTSILFMVPVMAQQAIDVHCHNVLPEFTEFLERHGAALEETFPLPEWDVNSHLEFMDNAGVGKAILLMPAPQPYYGDSEESRRIIRHYNEASARLKADCPDKFLFCASLPLPDVEAAVKEAVYALDTLGADGIKLATNSRGQYLGNPALDTLMSVLNQHHAVVILHPHKPVPVNDTLIATTPLAIYEYPAETTRTVVNMITHNVPARYPNIRFVIPHCGSFLPLAIPRMKMVHPAMVAKGLMNPIDWEANLKNLYYDLAGGATSDVIKTLLTITTPEHLMYGSDYPYQPAAVLTENLKKLHSALKSDDMLAPHVDDILFGNACKLFNMTK
ncbi:MAG: amidohydrolase [Prevotellaceae bacterium]|nr:amidohydrolase [Prevotellaceae bacterium]